MQKLALAMAALMACGGDDDGGPIEIDDLPGALISAYCNLYVNCGLVDDYATCRTLDLDADFDPELLAAVKAGLVHYDEGQAGVCIGGISATSCERGADFDEPEACDLVFTGTLGAGAECAIDEECVSNTCDVPSCPDACCKGTCIGDTPHPPRPHLGESCATDSRCVDSFCDAGTQTCLARKPLGSTCETNDECDVGVCLGTCSQLPRTGDPCVAGQSDAPCALIGDTCSPETNTCVPLGLTGDSCTLRSECSPIYDCTGGSCVLGPTLGESCAERDCIDNSFCNNAGMCQARQVDGAPCDDDIQCIGDCDFTTNTCVTAPVCI